jgi:hypothetical protein
MEINEALIGQEVVVTQTFQGVLEQIGPVYVTIQESNSEHKAIISQGRITSVEKIRYPQGTVVQDAHGIIYNRIGELWYKFNSTIPVDKLARPVIVISTPESRAASRSARLKTSNRKSESDARF